MPTTMRRSPAVHAAAAAVLVDRVGLAHAASPILLARLGDTSVAEDVTLTVDDATVTGDVNAVRGQGDLAVRRPGQPDQTLRVSFVAENIDDGENVVDGPDESDLGGFIDDGQPPYSIVRLEYVGQCPPLAS